MVLNTPFVGTGEFVPETVWSCSVHDEPVEHYCDCDLCTWEEPECCANAEWIDKRDELGNVVMRELSAWETMFRSFESRYGVLVAFNECVSKPDMKTNLAWLDDEFMPRITSGRNDV